jgi:predicted DNA-binding transcriptional regulator AlpA
VIAAAAYREDATMTKLVDVKPATELSAELRAIVTTTVRELMESRILGPEEIVRRKELPRYLGLKKTQIDKLIEAGILPPGVPLNETGRAIGWFKSTLVEHQNRLRDKAAALLAERAAARDARRLLTPGRPGRPVGYCKDPKTGQWGYKTPPPAGAGSSVTKPAKQAGGRR